MLNFLLSDNNSDFVFCFVVYFILYSPHSENVNWHEQKLASYCAALFSVGLSKWTIGATTSFVSSEIRMSLLWVKWFNRLDRSTLFYTNRECWTMSVDEDLVATRVPESSSFLFVAEQSAWKARQCLELRLIALSADVDDDSLTTRQRAVVMTRTVLTSPPRIVDCRHFQRRRLRLPCFVFAVMSASLFNCDTGIFYRRGVLLNSAVIAK